MAHPFRRILKKTRHQPFVGLMERRETLYLKISNTSEAQVGADARFFAHCDGGLFISGADRRSRAA